MSPSVQGGASATNEEKNRLKPFLLTKHSKALLKRRGDSIQRKQIRAGAHRSKRLNEAKNKHRRKKRRF